MKQRLLTVGLLAGCVILGAVSFLVSAGQDRKAPKITIEDQDISYTEGDKYDSLLEGVSARDNIDGDVTEEVFVDKVVPTKKGKAVVYYGVTDSNNNVGTARRSIAYTEDPEAEEAPEEEKEEPTEEENPAGEEPTEEESEKEDSEEEELKPDGERPAIALTETEVTVKKGTAFDPMSVVKDVIDDKDSRDALYQRISADGERNTDQAGTYSIRYYVRDSDGNTSEAETLTLTVE